LVAAWLAVALAGGAVAWTGRAVEPAAGRALPPQRLRAVVWNGPRVAAAFLVFFFLPIFIVPHLDPTTFARRSDGGVMDPKVAGRLAQCAAAVLALPFQVAAWCGLLAAAGAPTPPLRPSRRRIVMAYVAAFRTWVLLTPLVYAVNFAVLVMYGLLVGKQPDEHPILQTFQEGSLPVVSVVLLVIEAVVAAPIREELVFRGTVQPWLADRPWGGDVGLVVAAVVGVAFHAPAHISIHDPASVLSAAAPLLLVLALWPLYRMIDRSSGLARWLPVRDPARRRQAARAVVGTAAVFANFHANVWPTPIPLLVLALGLGWLAYRTQSVLAPVVMHMLFNAVVFAALILK
jgi:membrane protease YdiL (CAAX protease family)